MKISHDERHAAGPNITIFSCLPQKAIIEMDTSDEKEELKRKKVGALFLIHLRLLTLHFLSDLTSSR